MVAVGGKVADVYIADDVVSFRPFFGDSGIEMAPHILIRNVIKPD